LISIEFYAKGRIVYIWNPKSLFMFIVFLFHGNEEYELEVSTILLAK